MVGHDEVGFAFQPWFWLLFAASFSLSEYVRRVLVPVKRSVLTSQFAAATGGALVPAGRARG